VKVTKEILRQMILDGEDISKLDYSHIADMSYMFCGCKEIIETPLIDTSKVKHFGNMFSGCKNLKKINKMDLSSAIHLTDMFQDCISLEKVDEIIAPEAKDLLQMFLGCTLLKVVNYIYAPKSENIIGMFQDCERLETVREFDTSSVKFMDWALSNCKIFRHKKLDWDFSSMENMYKMVEGPETFIKMVGEDRVKDILIDRAKKMDEFKYKAMTKSLSKEEEKEKLIELVQYYLIGV